MPVPSMYLDEVQQDLRVAVRRARRMPALTIAIILTIALGLGAAAAIFTTFEAALLEPLPYAEPQQLVLMEELRSGTNERSRTSYATFLDWRSRAASFSALEGYDGWNLTVGVGDNAQSLRGAQLTPGFFRLLGVRPSAGRDFLLRDADASAGVAIVSSRLARSVAGNPLNQTIALNGSPFLIVGVLPDAFHFAGLQDADVFVPLVPDADRRSDRTNRSVQVIGRLRGRVPMSAARSELAGVMATIATEHPEAMAGRTVDVTPLRDAFLGNMKPILTSLLIAVALLLVIMGTNLALLMLTRYVERSPELAMRSALGATRSRVLRQLLAESLAPALVGAVLAIVIGQVAAGAIVRAIPENLTIGMPYLSNIRLDGTTMVLVTSLTTVLAVAFGIGPAMLMTKQQGRISDARTTLARGDRRLRRSLVAAQLSLTVVLLVSSGLLITSFSKLVSRNVGFADPETLITARANLFGPRYSDDGAQQQFYETLIARIAAIPGIRSASGINEIPGGGSGNTTFTPVDRPRPRSQQPRATLRIVGGDYFSTMGIRLIEGRALDARDGNDAPGVAVVSESLAKRLAEDGATVGRRLQLSQADNVEWEVVGVVGDVQVAALDAESPPVIYLSHQQRAENRLTLVLRTALPIAAVSRQLSAIVKDMDPGIPVYGVATIAQKLGESQAVFTRRLPMILCGVFASAALALTLIALYAICMHEVQARRREFGIRMALGSTPGLIRRLILNDAVMIGVVGVAAGIVVAIVVTRSMQAVLFGIAANDWRVYLAVAGGVLGSALIATLVPAARAAAVNPGVVMRQE